MMQPLNRQVFNDFV